MQLWIKNKGISNMALLLGIMRGAVLVVRSITKNFLATSEVVEALAALHAVEISKEMDFHDIILEGDTIQIVNVIKATNNNWSSIGHIVDDIKLELR
jgi:ribonuclease HI